MVDRLIAAERHLCIAQLEFLLHIARETFHRAHSKALCDQRGGQVHHRILGRTSLGMYPSISEKEFAAVSALPPEKRYSHSIKHIADWHEVWSLHNAVGWVLAGDGAGHEIIPTWPRPRYAKACAEGSWSNCEPKAIELSAWSNGWLPGIERDRSLICVFMTPNLKGVTATAEVLKLDLEEELDCIE